MQGSRRKSTTLNSLLKLFPALVNGSVKRIVCLKCVHVHKSQEESRLFSIFCDHEFKRRSFKLSDVQNTQGRFSGLTYKHSTSSKIHVGQVMCIILHKSRNLRGEVENALKFLMARLVSSDPSSIVEKRDCPIRKVQYCLHHGQVVIDAISHVHITAPLFLVPALDFNMSMTDVGSSRGNAFYMIEEGTVKCNDVQNYESYFQFNNTALCYKLGKSVSKDDYFNLPPYMSVHDLMKLRMKLDICNDKDDMNHAPKGYEKGLDKNYSEDNTSESASCCDVSSDDESFN